MRANGEAAMGRVIDVEADESSGGEVTTHNDPLNVCPPPSYTIAMYTPHFWSKSKKPSVTYTYR